jgi:nucleoid-associated protein YgaU
MSSPNGFTAAAVAPSTNGAGARPTLQHAVLDLRDPPVGKTSLQPGASRGQIEFQFNPKELTIAKSAKWERNAQKGSKKSAVPQYGGPEPSKLTLEMFLDASAKQDDAVVKTVEKLFQCCVPTDESHQKKMGTPPWVVFRWGGITSFTAYVKSVSVKYTLFTAAGVPIRGIATVNLEEIAGEQSGQNPTSGALAARAVHTVVSGDTLQSIAYREYGDPTVWRAIAEANDIDDPMRLRIGSTLLVPASEELTG